MCWKSCSIHSFHRYNVYFYGFVGCEILNLIVVLLQFGLTNIFLHYRFLGYGPKVSLIGFIFHPSLQNFLSWKVFSYYRLPEEEQKEHKNPMCDAFPRIGNWILRHSINCMASNICFSFLQLLEMGVRWISGEYKCYLCSCTEHDKR